MYRRRRIVVLIGALIVLALLVAGVWGLVSLLGGGSDPSASGAPAASSTSSPAAKPEPSSPAPSPTPSCDPGKITVTASTDKAVYEAGEKPVLSLEVRNGGAVACDVNVGTSQMEYLVMSGQDRIFSSKDCQTGSEDLTKKITAGSSEKANFAWTRTRSVEGCGKVSAVPGPGFYSLTTTLGGVQGKAVSFELRG